MATWSFPESGYPHGYEPGSASVEGRIDPATVAELKRRANGFTKNLATLFQSISVEFRMIHGLDPTNFDAIRTNFFNQTVEEWLVYNGLQAVTGNQGFRLPAIVEQFPWDQPLEEVSGHDMRLALAYFEEPAGVEIDPAWAVTP